MPKDSSTAQHPFVRIGNFRLGGLFPLCPSVGKNPPASLRPISGVDAIGIQDIAQSHHTFQLVHVSTAHYRQDFDLVCAHPFERQIKPLVRVDVWKNTRIHELTQLLGNTFRPLSFERREVDKANYTSSIGHQPRSQSTRTDPF